MIKGFIRDNVFGKLKYQKMFEKIFRWSLEGMNIGGGTDCDDSGELKVIRTLAAELAAKSGVIFDVGANVGEYTKLVLDNFSHPQIHAFEPDKKCFETLVSKYDDNQKVKLNNFGLSSSQGERDIYIFDNNQSGLNSFYKRRLDHFNIGVKEVHKISVDSLDNYCVKNNIEKIDFLKIDVEGHEMEVLLGAQKMLDKSKIYCIQFEFGGCNIDSRTYFQDFWYLLSPKYRLYRILKDGLMEIEKYTEVSEVFITTNYLAILK